MVHFIEIYNNYCFYPLIWAQNMDFVDRKYLEHLVNYFTTSISLGWWQLIIVGSNFGRLRLVFLQKLRFSYIFSYISIQNMRQNKQRYPAPFRVGEG